MTTRGDHPAPAPLAIDPVRLNAPAVNHEIVGHERLLRLRPAPDAASVVVVTAPAGYGKTTAVAEWAAHSPAPTLWVSLDRHMNDPVILATHIACAVLSYRADPELEAAVRTRATTVWFRLVPRLSAALQRFGPHLLILDDVDVISEPDSRDVIDWLMLHVPTHAQLVLAGRSSGSHSESRLRVEGRLAVVGADDLGLSDAEAQALLRVFGLPVSATEAAELNRACEGWVSGLVMHARSAGVGRRPPVLSTSNTLLREYVAAEVLDRLDPESRDLMLQASVLRIVTGPMLDAVLARTGSDRLLQRLCSENAFVSRQPDGTCRLHELVRDALQHRLESEDPDRVATLLGRSAAWHAEHGNPEDAVEYAIRAGQLSEAARLIVAFAPHEFGLGRLTTLGSWLTWAEANGLVGNDAALTAAGSLAQALSGEPRGSERWANSLDERALGQMTSPEDREAAGYQALLAAWQCRDGAEAMLRSATRAVEFLGDQGPWSKSALTCLAFARLMHGHSHDACLLFERVVEESGLAAADTTARYASALMLAREALAERDLLECASWLERARDIRLASGAMEQGLEALEDALLAQVVMVRGQDPHHARRLLAHAQPIRSLVSWAMPSPALRIKLELITAHVMLTDVAAARVLLREAFDILHWRPGLGTYEAEAIALRERVSMLSGSDAGPSSLTSAELRLVPWLATHLSFREIGERLFLSSNTVKTEALSVYRKLGASSRSAAVEAAVEAGLLDEAALPGVLVATQTGDDIS